MFGLLPVFMSIGMRIVPACILLLFLDAVRVDTYVSRLALTPTCVDYHVHVPTLPFGPAFTLAVTWKCDKDS